MSPSHFGGGPVSGGEFLRVAHGRDRFR